MIEGIATFSAETLPLVDISGGWLGKIGEGKFADSDTEIVMYSVMGCVD